MRATVRSSVSPSDVDEETASPVFEGLAERKRAVGALKETMSAVRWRAMVEPPMPRQLPRPHAGTRSVSRAFYKLAEIFSSCALPYPSRSLHLCEAPGGFVQCIDRIHPDASTWSWVAVSLPPHASEQERVPLFLTDLLPMSRGRVVLADVGDASALLSHHVQSGSFDLVTADGSSDLDPERLEELHLPLLWKETRAALEALSRGGVLVIKFFEGRRVATLKWIAFLTLHFEAVSVIKPVTSRPTNSERYAVCQGYAPPDDHPSLSNDMDASAHVLSKHWIRDTHHVLESLASRQDEAIKSLLSRASLSSSPRPRGDSVH